MAFRKRKGLNTVSLEEATEPSEDFNSIPHPEFIADWRQSQEHLVEKNEIRLLLDDALTRLDEKHRLVFLLRDVEGLSIQESVYLASPRPLNNNLGFPLKKFTRCASRFVLAMKSVKAHTVRDKSMDEQMARIPPFDSDPSPGWNQLGATI